MPNAKVLSEKQNQALARIARKYQSMLTDKELVAAILGASLAEPAAVEQDPGEIPSLLQILSTVTAWEAPVKKGRFTVDDKKFYESLNKQFNDKKTLSEKQIAALKKLAAKYGEK